MGNDMIKRTFFLSVEISRKLKWLSFKEGKSESDLLRVALEEKYGGTVLPPEADGLQPVRSRQGRPAR